MKEKEISFIRNEDPTLVVLSEKKQKEFNKAYDDLRFASTHLSNLIKENNLDNGFKHSLCSLLESHVQTMTKCLGYEGDLKEESQKRFKEIRELNIENRELRKQLGDKCTPEDVRESLKNLSENFRRWWNIFGFGHCSDDSFGGYGFKATLSGMITDSYYDKDENADTEETKVLKLRTQGFDIKDGDSRSDRKILYTDKNIQLLISILKSKFPSVSISHSKAYHGRKEESEIREIEIYIRDLNDLSNE